MLNKYDTDILLKELERRKNQSEAQERQAKLQFNGRDLSWIENGQVTKSWPAMSGQPNYQCKKYTPLQNKGSIPEGQWHVNQNQYQDYNDPTFMERAKRLMGRNNWRGGENSWGTKRVWLQPQDETQTFGRNGFSKHGGNNFGSLGCVDLAQGMDDFADDYRDYGKDMTLDILYDQDCW